MIHVFGMQNYADVMSNFAAGERYINRVWSASTDGYVDEVGCTWKGAGSNSPRQRHLTELLDANSAGPHKSTAPDFLSQIHQ